MNTKANRQGGYTIKNSIPGVFQVVGVIFKISEVYQVRNRWLEIPGPPRFVTTLYR